MDTVAVVVEKTRHCKQSCLGDVQVSGPNSMVHRQFSIGHCSTFRHWDSLNTGWNSSSLSFNRRRLWLINHRLNKNTC